MNLYSLFETAVDLVLPPSADEKRIRAITTLSADPQYIQTRSGIAVYTAHSYNDPDVRAVIHTLKYHGNKKSVELCSQLVEDMLTEEIAERAFWDTASSVVIPIPLSQKRMRERGFNQVEKILYRVPNVRTDILIRTTNVPPQTTLSGDERISNVTGVFTAANPEVLKGASVIIVDDIVTTGATLAEASRTLRKAGAQDVLTVALARAER